VCGPLAVRLDMLERLADLIRDARQADKARRFTPAPAMMNLLGCDEEALCGVLRALGYRRVRKAEGESPELWASRARREPDGEARQAPPPADTPFAALAALSLTPPARPAPMRAAKPRRPRARRAGKGKRA
jgi:ATP-dependent RNA helicase SUPV3L1/SUV3